MHQSQAGNKLCWPHLRKKWHERKADSRATCSAGHEDEQRSEEPAVRKEETCKQQIRRYGTTKCKLDFEGQAPKNKHFVIYSPSCRSKSVPELL